MDIQQPNNPLHGVTLEMILNDLVAYFGWEKLGDMITIKCFRSNPSVSSSLKFLRKTPWARSEVEELYIRNFNKIQKSKGRE
ncbi:MAG: DUF2132 domain-containing protein [Bacteroidetes bacterium]|nr:DUF2132 domain-containing protein [Bacteroidota bacterium]